VALNTKNQSKSIHFENNKIKKAFCICVNEYVCELGIRI
jgi:hypothetical protein